MFQLKKVITANFFLFALSVGPAGALVKEGGNSVLDQNGNVISSKISCLTKTSLKSFVADQELEGFNHLSRTFEQMTYKKINDKLDLCVLEGGEKEITEILGAPSITDDNQERVAGWLPPYAKKNGMVLITEKFLEDVNSHQNNRTKASLATSLFREVLHNTLHSKSLSLSWLRRDHVISGVLEKILLKSKELNISVSRDEFQAFNQYLEEIGFPSGFEVKGLAYNLDVEFSTQSELENFIHYLELAAGKIIENNQFKDLMLTNLFLNCFKLNYEEGQSCLDYYNQALNHLRDGGQQINFNYRTQEDRKLTRYMSELINFMRIGQATKNNINPLFLPYAAKSDDLVDFQDLKALIIKMSESRDAINFSERFILVSFLNQTFLDIPQYFLGLTPFVNSGLISYKTKFSCRNGFNTTKTTISDLYFMTKGSWASHNMAARQRVDIALKSELPESFFKHRFVDEDVADALVVMMDDDCYL